jgi:hypothetical protein
MPDHFQTEPFAVPSSPSPIRASLHPPLPEWLARRLLRPGEEISWVRGPRWRPSWEPHVTHPVLFLYALALGAVCIVAARLSAGSWEDTHPLPVFAGVGIVLLSIYVLAFFNGYFTRLVVTNLRLFIVQGFEVRSSWNIDALPRSLLRHGPRKDGLDSPTIDLDAVQTMLGGSSDQFTDSKTIRSFGKQIAQIKARENGRPDR